MDCESFKEEIKNALQNNKQHEAVAKIREYLEKVNNTPLNIGITGESGSGKSTFVNAFRGIGNQDEGAAPTGCVETTFEVTPYAHPNYPNVILWDLPGIGTTTFPADKYLKKVGFEKFDFFIIISDTRFRQNDVNLALEIQKMGKKFYFVRSKIDNDLRSEERSQREFSQEETLQRIRLNCVQGLQQQNIESPQVFLISSFDQHPYDFLLLQETLERELPDHKKHALLMAMPVINLDIIEKKKKAFHSKIKFHATLSAAVAGVPIPGLSQTLMAGVVTQYAVGFGLDVPSLKRLAISTGVPLQDLISVILSPLAARTITADLLMKLLLQNSSLAASLIAEEAFTFIPLLGIPVTMSLSFTNTYKALTMFLDMLADDAQRVFQRAIGLNASV